jgi:hypothetical protein
MGRADPLRAWFGRSVVDGAELGTVSMDDRMTVQAYETPRVVDYGDLQELTAGCQGATGGDAYTAVFGGYAGVSASNPAIHYKCTSTP